MRGGKAESEEESHLEHLAVAAGEGEAHAGEGDAGGEGAGGGAGGVGGHEGLPLQQRHHRRRRAPPLGKVRQKRGRLQEEST